MESTFNYIPTCVKLSERKEATKLIHNNYIVRELSIIQ